MINLKEKRGVLFDLDGTILDTGDLILASSRYCTQQVLGKTFSDEFYKAENGKPLDYIIATFTDDTKLQEEMIKVYREHNVAHNDQMIKAYSGMEDIFAALQARGVKQGVVTSKITKLAKHSLSLFGFDKFLEFVIGAYDCKEHKPQPGPVLMGVERMGLCPSECIYIGDSPYDIEAGSSAGCATIGVLWGMFDEEKLSAAKPDFICKTTSELKSLLV